MGIRKFQLQSKDRGRIGEVWKTILTISNPHKKKSIFWCKSLKSKHLRSVNANKGAGYRRITPVVGLSSRFVFASYWRDPGIQDISK